jgi:hypothetical protein
MLGGTRYAGAKTETPAAKGQRGVEIFNRQRFGTSGRPERGPVMEAQGRQERIRVRHVNRGG